MFCKKCGSKIDEDSVFCQKCGKKQNQSDNNENQTGKIVCCICSKAVNENSAVLPIEDITNYLICEECEKYFDMLETDKEQHIQAKQHIEALLNSCADNNVITFVRCYIVDTDKNQNDVKEKKPIEKNNSYKKSIAIISSILIITTISIIAYFSMTGEKFEARKYITSEEFSGYPIGKQIQINSMGKESYFTTAIEGAYWTSSFKASEFASNNKNIFPRSFTIIFEKLDENTNKGTLYVCYSTQGVNDSETIEYVQKNKADVLSSSYILNEDDTITINFSGLRSARENMVEFYHDDGEYWLLELINNGYRLKVINVNINEKTFDITNDIYFTIGKAD